MKLYLQYEQENSSTSNTSMYFKQTQYTHKMLEFRIFPVTTMIASFNVMVLEDPFPPNAL